MARFKLVPLEQESAMEQLWKAAKMATYVIARKHKCWHLHGEYFDEAVDRIVFTTVTSFIENKLKRKTYSYVAKDGKKLTFFDNVLSSCFGCAGNVIDKYIKELDLMNKTADIEEMKFCISEKDKLPIYRTWDECQSKRHRFIRKFSELKRPRYRAERVKAMYEDYVDEAREMGLSNILEFGPWLCRCGYNEDEELMWALEPKPVRRSMLAERLKMMKKKALIEDEAHLDESTRKYLTNRRNYHKEYARKRRERERAEIDRKLREVLGPPPEGYQWFEMQNGRVGQRRLKK